MKKTTLIFISLLLLISSCFASYSVQDSINIRKNGFLKFKANIDTFYVTTDYDFKNSIAYVKGDSLLLSVGFHNIIVSGFDFSDISFSIGVEENKISTFEFKAKKEVKENQSDACLINYWKGNVVFISDSLTKITINDTLSLKPFSHIYLKNGKYSLKYVHISGYSIEKNMTVENNKFYVNEEYLEPNQITNVFLSLIPGMSQIYKGESQLSVLYQGLFYFSTLFVYSYQKESRISENNWFYFPAIFYGFFFYESLKEPIQGFRKPSKPFNSIPNVKDYVKK